MFVDGKPAFVYQARVSRLPVNQIWPGYQRPLNQTEIASFAYFVVEVNGSHQALHIFANTIEAINIDKAQLGLKFMTIKNPQ